MTKLMLGAALAALAAAPVLAQGLPGIPTDAAGLASAAATAGLGDALSVENFDPEKVKAMVAQAPIEETQKETLNAAVDKAAENPELVQGAIDQVKAALGL